MQLQLFILNVSENTIIKHPFESESLINTH